MHKPIQILLVEDNADDIAIMQEVLVKHGLADNLAIARDGEEALAYIYKQGAFANVKTPDVVLLDLNLPRKNGLEVLNSVRNSSNYSYLPIIVLSTSSSPDDIAQSYQSHANCFITKPFDIVTLYNMIGSLKSFWINTAQLPTAHV